MVTLLAGPNAHARSEKLAELKQAFQNEHGSSGIERYAGEKVEPTELYTLLVGVSLFASHRLVILSDLSTNKPASEKFIALIDEIPSEIHVVLIESQPDKRTSYYKTLQKKAAVVLCDELDAAAVAKWVGQYVQQNSGKIESSVVQYLVQHVGNDQQRLSNELDKLLAYDATITKEAINLLVERQPEDTIFQLLEYALSGKKGQALDVLAGLERAHEDPYQTVGMLIWQTQILAIVSSGGAPGESQIAKEAKFNPFVVKKTKALAGRLSRQQINIILDSVAELDVTLKSAGADPWRVLEAALLSF